MKLSINSHPLRAFLFMFVNDAVLRRGFALAIREAWGCYCYLGWGAQVETLEPLPFSSSAPKCIWVRG